MAVLGAIWGSFAAALCQRWPNGESVVKGRSRCDGCKATLRAYELVPIVSYLIQSGQCRRCGANIGRTSIATELACASLGLIAAVCFQGYAMVATALLFWLLVPLFILDWQHLWLPDSLVLTLALFGVLVGEVAMGTSLQDRLIGGAAGFASLEAIRQGFRKLRRVEGMGGGDPKLLGAIGLWMGWQALPMILLIASIVGILYFLFRPSQSSTPTVHLPLGSFLAMATVAFCLGNTAM